MGECFDLVWVFRRRNVWKLKEMGQDHLYIYTYTYNRHFLLPSQTLSSEYRSPTLATRPICTFLLCRPSQRPPLQAP